MDQMQPSGAKGPGHHSPRPPPGIGRSALDTGRLPAVFRLRGSSRKGRRGIPAHSPAIVPSVALDSAPVGVVLPPVSWRLGRRGSWCLLLGFWWTHPVPLRRRLCRKMATGSLVPQSRSWIRKNSDDYRATPELLRVRLRDLRQSLVSAGHSAQRRNVLQKT